LHCAPPGVPTPRSWWTEGAVAKTLQEVRRRGIDAAGAAAPLASSQARPNICSMHEAVGANSIEDAIALGRKIVTGIVVTQVGNNCQPAPQYR